MMKKYRNIYDKRSGHCLLLLFEPISLLLQHINERVNLRRLGNNNRLTYERNKMTITELKQCIDCYGKEIYGFCRHITGNLQDREDLYQDTFLKAVELADKIDIKRKSGLPMRKEATVFILMQWRRNMLMKIPQGCRMERRKLMELM